MASTHFDVEHMTGALVVVLVFTLVGWCHFIHEQRQARRLVAVREPARERQQEDRSVKMEQKKAAKMEQKKAGAPPAQKAHQRTRTMEGEEATNGVVPAKPLSAKQTTRMMARQGSRLDVEDVSHEQTEMDSSSIAAAGPMVGRGFERTRSILGCLCCQLSVVLAG